MHRLIFCSLEGVYKCTISESRLAGLFDRKSKQLTNFCSVSTACVVQTMYSAELALNYRLFWRGWQRNISCSFASVGLTHGSPVKVMVCGNGRVEYSNYWEISGSALCYSVILQCMAVILKTQRRNKCGQVPVLENAEFVDENKRLPFCGYHTLVFRAKTAHSISNKWFIGDNGNILHTYPHIHKMSIKQKLLFLL